MKLSFCFKSTLLKHHNFYTNDPRHNPFGLFEKLGLKLILPFKDRRPLHAHKYRAYRRPVRLSFEERQIAERRQLRETITRELIEQKRQNELTRRIW